MSDEIQDVELRASIINGCKDYLNMREHEWFFQRWYSGEEPGDEIHAFNILKAALDISTYADDREIFSLALLFVTLNRANAQRFPECIAEYLFQGKITKGYDDTDEVVAEGEMTSSAFSQEALNAATEEKFNFDAVHFEGDGVPVFWKINKVKCAQSILKNHTLFGQTPLQKAIAFYEEKLNTNQPALK